MVASKDVVTDVERFAVAWIQAIAMAAPWVVIGYLIAAVLREYVPESHLRRWFAGRGWRGLGAATGVGALLPLCSCSVIPLGVGLAKSGAARGPVLAFLVSAPAISPVALILGYTLLGPTLTLLYAAVVVGGALILGIIANRWWPSAETTPAQEPLVKEQISFTARLRRAGRWAFWDLGAEISVDLIIGLTLAAVVLAVLPMSWIATWVGPQTIWTLIYIIIIGIPVYTCSVPSLPVVHSLLLAGMSPGAAIAYLIAGPATNLGELLVLRRQLGARVVILFALGLVTLAFAGGLIADHVFYRDYNYQPSPAAAGAPIGTCCVVSFLPQGDRMESLTQLSGIIPWWHWPFVAVLLCTLAVGLWQRSVKRRLQPTQEPR